MTPRWLASRLAAADAALARAGAARVAWIAVLAGITVRAAVVLTHPAQPDGDERYYLALAENLARLGRYSVEPGGPLETHYGPLYTLLQAGLTLFGLSSLHAGWTLSVLAGGLAAGIVYRLGLQTWERPVAAAAAASAVILHPQLLDASRRIYTETLSSLFLLLAVGCLGLRRHPGILAGIALGLAALTRRESAFLAPVFAAWFFWQSRTALPRPSFDQRRQAVGLLVSFLILFAPYIVYLRFAAGHWTMSGRTNYSWIVGRLMQERPGEGLPLEQVRELEARYPTPIDWFLAKPWETTVQLTQGALYHLRLAFFPWRGWPIGLFAIAGLGWALASHRLSLRPSPPFLLPFLLVLPWSIAGPILRYSWGIVPFVCVLVGGLLLRGPGRAEGLKTPP